MKRLLCGLLASLSLGLLSGIPARAQGPPDKGGTRPAGRDRPAELKVDLQEPTVGLVKNPRFFTKSTDANVPMHYTLDGDAKWVWCGRPNEDAESGIALDCGKDVSKGGRRSGAVTQRVTGFSGGVGKWLRFTFRGLAERNFAVEKDALFLRVDYFSERGANPLDGVNQNIYAVVERDRTQLARNGRFFRDGGAAWKTYALDFRLPFAEIDTLALSVGFKNGSAKAENEAEFFVTEFALTPIPAPSDAPKVVRTEKGVAPDLGTLIPLGGRWYYDPEATLKGRPATLVVTAKNANRLFYRDGRLSNPFAENMTAWLRPGHLDREGDWVETERFLPDSVVLEFKGGQELVVHSRNIPNHPTAAFPGRDAGPNPIQEGDSTYYLPLEPVRNPKAVAMDKTNSNRALPMGPVGFAVNGVAFFNPFDMGRVEAVDLVDRCCGHPAPNNQYHYHKYPVCVKSPFVDDGEGHSPLIGFALDGFPLYGPYVAKGLMAKDDKEKPLDAFNMRFDDERGWHYHVTPGQYPYLIGGFAGTPDPRNGRRGPPR